MRLLVFKAIVSFIFTLFLLSLFGNQKAVAESQLSSADFRIAQDSLGAAPPPSPPASSPQPLAPGARFELVANLGVQSVFFDPTSMYDIRDKDGDVLAGGRFRVVFNNQRPVVNGYALGSVVTVMVASCGFNKMMVVYTDAFDHAGKFLFSMPESTLIDVPPSGISTTRTKYVVLCSGKVRKKGSSTWV